MNLPHPILYGPEGEPTSGSLGGDPSGNAVSVTPANENPFSNDWGSTSTTTPPPATTPPPTPTPQTPPPAQGGDPTPDSLINPPANEGARKDPPPAQPTTPQAIHLTPEQFRELAGRQQQPTAPAQPELTKEQINQMFGVVELTAQQYTDILGIVPEKPEQVAALNNFGQALVKQALKIADVRIQMMQRQINEQLTGQITPIAQAHRAQEETQLMQGFYSANPHLVGYEALVDELKDNLKRQYDAGQDPLSLAGLNKQQRIAKAYEYVAGRARAFLTRSGTQPTTTTSPQNGQPQQQPSQRRMTPTQMGGRVSGASATAPANDAEAIYG